MTSAVTPATSALPKAASAPDRRSWIASSEPRAIASIAATRRSFSKGDLRAGGGCSKDNASDVHGSGATEIDLDRRVGDVSQW